MSFDIRTEGRRPRAYSADRAWRLADVAVSRPRTNWNTEPRGVLGKTDSMPSWASMIDRQIDSPIPMPPDLVVKSGLNTRGASSGPMPLPVSAIEIITRPSS